jgi:hypothetical protein
MKQKTDIRARRQHSTVPVDEMCPPSPSYRAGSQAPQFNRDRPKHTPPVSAHHTRRTNEPNRRDGRRDQRFFQPHGGAKRPAQLP